MFEKTKAKVNGWLDAKPGRRNKASAIGCWLMGIGVGVFLVQEVKILKNLTSPETKPVINTEEVLTLVGDHPIPNTKKGIIEEFYTYFNGENSGLAEAIVKSGEFEFLDDRTLTVKDLGAIGEAFINVDGPKISIDPDTAVDLVITFQNRA